MAKKRKDEEPEATAKDSGVIKGPATVRVGEGSAPEMVEPVPALEAMLYLDGKEIAEAVVRRNRAQQLADEAAMLGRMTPLERARFAFGLEEAHVLGAKEHPQPDGSVHVVLVTQGGQRLRWPEDEGRVLAQHEKDGTVPGAPPAGIFKAPAKK